MEKEVSESTEWTRFDDDWVTSVEENWFGIVKECIDFACYPTVLFYEKLDAEDRYEKSKSFELTSQNKTYLTSLSTESDINHSNNFEDIYGSDYI
jgi:hypothetical protein